MNNKHVRVSEYSIKMVLPEHREKFIELIMEWDDSTNVVNSWYNWNFLTMKHNEVIEWINQNTKN